MNKIVLNSIADLRDAINADRHQGRTANIRAKFAAFLEAVEEYGPKRNVPSFAVLVVIAWVFGVLIGAWVGFGATP